MQLWSEVRQVIKEKISSLVKNNFNVQIFIIIKYLKFYAFFAY